MSKFQFSTNSTAMIGGVRVSQLSHHKIKSIAKLKGVTMQEVVRVLLDVALDEFEKEYQEHYFSPPNQPTKANKE